MMKLFLNPLSSCSKAAALIFKIHVPIFSGLVRCDWWSLGERGSFLDSALGGKKSVEVSVFNIHGVSLELYCNPSIE